MKLKNVFMRYFPMFVLLCITILFFYKSFFKGYIPFPGDLLIAEYQPWKSFQFEGYNPGSFPHKAQYFDTIRQLYPWKFFSIEELKTGRLPLWNPHNFSGAPLFANLQSALLYPTTLLFLVFPFNLSWTLSVILQPLIAALFTYVFARKLQFSESASLYSSIAYGFSLYMTVFLEYNTIGHVILWLPAILFCIESYFQFKKNRYLIGIALSTAFSLFAGHLQLFGGIVLFSVGYILYRTYGESILSLRRLMVLLFLGLGIGISAIQLIPTLELTIHSSRVSHTSSELINRFLIQPKQLFMFLSPDVFGNPVTRNYSFTDSYPSKAMYVGVISLFLALLSIRNKRKPLSFFMFTSGILLFLLLRHPITELIYSISIPFVSSSAPTNFLFLLSFCLAMMAGNGLDSLLKNRTFPISSIIFLSFSGALLLIFSAHFMFVRSQVLLTLGIIVTTVIIGIIATKRRIPNVVISFFCISILTLELGYFFLKFNPFVPSSMVYPRIQLIEELTDISNYNRFWGYGSADIQSNLATLFGLYSPNGYDPLYPKTYGEFISFSEQGNVRQQFNEQTRSDATIIQGFQKEGFIKNPYRDYLLRLLNVKYIVNHTENTLDEAALPPARYSLVLNDGPFSIYEDNQVLPRAFIVDSLPETLSVINDFTERTGNAAIKTYLPTYIEIHAETTQSGYLVLSDTYFPGWVATVNNQQVSIQKAYHSLRGINVPQGKSIITMNYKPNSIIYGSAISILSILVLLIILQFRK